MDKPAVYRIKVKGVVPDSWLERLGGLQLTASNPEGSILEGWMPDQAALHGVLHTLYSLHLPIVAVTRLPETPPDTKTDAKNR